jgi:NADH dehydrogenase FAD-containing subunit
MALVSAMAPFPQAHNPTPAAAAAAMNAAQLAAENARLAAELAALKATKEQNSRITFKVSEKGAVSVYGLGRWPVTLYKEQWERLSGEMENLKSFIATAKGLSVKQ